MEREWNLERERKREREKKTIVKEMQPEAINCRPRDLELSPTNISYLVFFPTDSYMVLGLWLLWLKTKTFVAREKGRNH